MSDYLQMQSTEQDFFGTHEFVDFQLYQV